jgi:hypothetical protein
MIKNKLFDDTYYDDLTVVQLSEKLHSATNDLFTEEKYGGILTMPISYPKSLQEKISKVAKIENAIYFKVQKENEKNE